MGRYPEKPDRNASFVGRPSRWEYQTVSCKDCVEYFQMWVIVKEWFGRNIGKIFQIHVFFSRIDGQWYDSYIKCPIKAYDS